MQRYQITDQMIKHRPHKAKDLQLFPALHL